MRSTGYAAPFISQWSTVFGAFRSSLFQREVAPSAVRCCTTLLLCFSIIGIQASGISIPLSLLMLLGWSLMWIASLTLWVYQWEKQISKRIMASLVGVLRNGGGTCMGTGKSYIPVVLFDSLMHRSPCFPDVDFTTFMGNPVNRAILFSRIDGVLRSHHMWPKCHFAFEEGANALLF